MLHFLGYDSRLSARYDWIKKSIANTDPDCSRTAQNMLDKIDLDNVSDNGDDIRHTVVKLQDGIEFVYSLSWPLNEDREFSCQDAEFGDYEGVREDGAIVTENVEPFKELSNSQLSELIDEPYCMQHLSAQQLNDNCGIDESSYNSRF